MEMSKQKVSHEEDRREKKAVTKMDKYDDGFCASWLGGVEIFTPQVPLPLHRQL